MNLDERCPQIKATYDYIDLIQFWLRQPLSVSELRHLGAHSKKMKLAKDIHTVEPAWWDPFYKQIVRLYQPREEAIRLLAKLDDALLNSVEIARDYILRDEGEVLGGLQFTAEHFVQPWHRKRRFKVFANGNWRTGDLNRPGVVFQGYGDRPSKVTGEIDCLHIEAKLRGVRAVRRAGIDHPNNLLDFPYSEFWENNLSLFEADRERLGRHYLNHIDKSRLQSTETTNGYNYQKRTGGFLCRYHGIDYETGRFSMQKVVDELGRGSWLIKLNLEHMLTATTSAKRVVNLPVNQGDTQRRGYG